MRKHMIGLCLMALFVLASAFAFGDDEAEVKGMITARAGATLIVSSSAGNVTVVLTAGTTMKDNKGLFGLSKQPLSDVVLIPGLKVEVEGKADEHGRIVAKTITTDGDDLETAEMIEAGLHPTAEQVEANVRRLEAHSAQLDAHSAQIAELAAQKQMIETNSAANMQQMEQNIKYIEETTSRFSALSEYDVKDAATINFNVGSSEISTQDQEQLTKLAQTAIALAGYIIEVTGYADSTGSAAMNTKLSEDRAKAVVTYLMQQASVPTRHIIAPGAMGEYGPAATNETKTGRAENRRVEVKILVNKGIAGS
ncbi:MAG: OmpA family protein [Terriglobales bacterium]|jgi:OOP family OmpA-OmpF porin